MSRERWAFVLVIYAIVGAVVFVFSGQPVAPCGGTVPTGQITPECFAAWQATLANRPLLERLFDTPWSGVAVFLVLVVCTWVVVRVRARLATGHSAPSH